MENNSKEHFLDLDKIFEDKNEQLKMLGISVDKILNLANLIIDLINKRKVELTHNIYAYIDDINKEEIVKQQVYQELFNKIDFNDRNKARENINEKKLLDLVFFLINERPTYDWSDFLEPSIDKIAKNVDEKLLED